MGGCRGRLALPPHVPRTPVQPVHRVHGSGGVMWRGLYETETRVSGSGHAESESLCGHSMMHDNLRLNLAGPTWSSARPSSAQAQPKWATEYGMRIRMLNRMHALVCFSSILAFISRCGVRVCGVAFRAVRKRRPSCGGRGHSAQGQGPGSRVWCVTHFTAQWVFRCVRQLANAERALDGRSLPLKLIQKTTRPKTHKHTPQTTANALQTYHP